MPEQITLPNGSLAWIPSPSEATADHCYKLLDKTVNTLADFKHYKLLQLEEACLNANASGFTSNALGTSHTYSSDDTAMKNFANEYAYLNSTGCTDTTVMWNTAEAGYVSHTVAQFNQVFKDGRAMQQANWDKLFKTLVPQWQTATTIDAVDAINW